jgi:hypothetical protein
VFHITKLSSTSSNFLGQISVSGKSRNIQTSIALGRVLADSLSLPSTPVDSITTLYNNQFRINIEQIISNINEICLLDVKQVLDFTLKFYTYRYNICNPDKVILAFNKDTAIEDFFKISKVFDNETIKVICENPIAITDLVNKFNIVIEEISK